ncbi:MAG TPA: branched-chain amino acid ABC transporter permease [Burkholderiales bacterium]|nr:branched-chain amino acid ABC transporter permease [Burkholderiales bacterium]
MTGSLAAYQSLLDLVLLNCGLALSQFVVLRAGVFSVATAGLASIGAYAAGIATLRWGAGAAVGLLAATAAGMLTALLLSLPLARLRGVYQAIATVAMVQIVLSLALYATDVTGGANGLNGVPKLVGTPELAILVLAMVYVLHSLGRSRIGYAFDAIRQDETVAVTLGVSVAGYQALAFGLSGAIAGLTGGLMAYHNRSVVPEEFGFGMLVTVLAYVVLGGRRSVLGPLVGALILSLLPELARPLADNRLIVHGAVLMLVITYLPHGIVDSLQIAIRRRATAASRAQIVGKEAPDGPA